MLDNYTLEELLNAPSSDIHELTTVKLNWLIRQIAFMKKITNGLKGWEEFLENAPILFPFDIFSLYVKTMKFPVPYNIQNKNWKQNIYNRPDKYFMWTGCFFYALTFWRKHKICYSFRPELECMLSNDDSLMNTSVRVLDNLPYNDFFISINTEINKDWHAVSKALTYSPIYESTLNYKDVLGYLVHKDKLGLFIQPIVRNHNNLICAFGESSMEFETDVDVSFKEILNRKMASFGKQNIKISDGFKMQIDEKSDDKENIIMSVPMYALTKVQDTMSIGFSLAEIAIPYIVYLCTSNSDIRYDKKRIAKHGTVIRDKTTEVAGYDVGYDITIRTKNMHKELIAYKQEGKEYHATGKNVRPHIRKAHWHSYWTGPLKGKRTLEIRWIAQIFVHGDVGETNVITNLVM